MKKSILYFNIVEPLGKHICMLHVDENDVQNAKKRLETALTEHYTEETTVQSIELGKISENQYILNVKYTDESTGIEYPQAFERTLLY